MTDALRRILHEVSDEAAHIPHVHLRVLPIDGTYEQYITDAALAVLRALRVQQERK